MKDIMAQEMDRVTQQFEPAYAHGRYQDALDRVVRLSDKSTISCGDGMPICSLPHIAFSGTRSGPVEEIFFLERRCAGSDPESRAAFEVRRANSYRTRDFSEWSRLEVVEDFRPPHAPPALLPSPSRFARLAERLSQFLAGLTKSELGVGWMSRWL